MSTTPPADRRRTAGGTILRTALASIGLCAGACAGMLGPLVWSASPALAAPEAIVQQASLGPRDLVLTPSQMGPNWVNVDERDSSDHLAYTATYINEPERRVLVLQVGVAEDERSAESTLYALVATSISQAPDAGIQPVSMDGLGDSQVFHGTMRAQEGIDFVGSWYVFRVQTSIVTVMSAGAPGTEAQLDEQSLQFARLQQERVRALSGGTA